MEKPKRKSGRKHEEEPVCKEEICKYIWSYRKNYVILHAKKTKPDMRKLLSTTTLTALLFFFSNLASAQTINNSADLEKFYTEFFNNRQSRDALVKGYCTDSLYQAWKASSSDEPFVFGGCDNHSGVQIRQLPKDNQYYVSFGYWFLGDDDYRANEGVTISVDKGKINKINHQVSLSISDLSGTKWQHVIKRVDKPSDYYEIDNEYDEYTNNAKIWHKKYGKNPSYHYYLTDTIPTKFESSKVGTATKGQYYIEEGAELYSSPIYYFNKEEGLMILSGDIYYIMKGKEIPKKFFKPREFPVNGPKYSIW